MRKIEANVIVRCSGIGHIMTAPQGKTNQQKHIDAVAAYALQKTNLKTAEAAMVEKCNVMQSLKIGAEDNTPPKRGKYTPAEKYEQAKEAWQKAFDKCAAIREKIQKAKDLVAETEASKDKPTHSATRRKYLKTMAIEIRHKRTKRMENKYVKKGRAVEPASVVAYGEFRGEEFEKNTERVYNEYLTGETDIDEADNEGGVEVVTDIKSSYDIDSFEDNRDEDAKKANYGQLQGYCALKNAKRGRVANVLVDNDFTLIDDALKQEQYKWPAADLEGFDLPKWRVVQILRDHIFTDEGFLNYLVNHTTSILTMAEYETLLAGAHFDLDLQREFDTFVEIPLDERVIEVEVDRDEEYIAAVYKAVEECRQYLEETYNIVHVPARAVL